MIQRPILRQSRSYLLFLAATGQQCRVHPRPSHPDVPLPAVRSPREPGHLRRVAAADGGRPRLCLLPLHPQSRRPARRRDRHPLGGHGHLRPLVPQDRHARCIPQEQVGGHWCRVTSTSGGGHWCHVTPTCGGGHWCHVTSTSGGGHWRLVTST